jgi:hypothetical protein
MKIFSQHQLKQLEGQRPAGYLQALLSYPADADGLIRVPADEFAALVKAHGVGIQAGNALGPRPSLVTVDEDLRAMDLPGMRAEIERLPDQQRIEGRALIEAQTSLITSATCTGCQQRRALATIRVWLQKARDAIKDSPLDSTTGNG